MIIQFDKPQCLRHKLPFLYICNESTCKCSVRLCLKCAQDHAKKKDVEDDFLKENVFAKKLEIETEIVAKQYNNLRKYKEKEK